MKIIPAIDLIDGKCVRLTKGDYTAKKIYGEDPLEVARALEDNGLKFLHLVDLDGARARRIVHYRVLEKLASRTSLSIDFGGGLQSDEDVEIAFACGARQVTGGSIAVKNREKFGGWIARYGADRIVLGADCKDRKIATDAWAQGSETDVIEFIQSYAQWGIREVISTDIAKDGMLQGPSLDLYRDILRETEVNVIASGGVSSFQDLLDLKALGCAGAIVGKAMYEGRITLKQLSSLC